MFCTCERIEHALDYKINTTLKSCIPCRFDGWKERGIDVTGTAIDIRLRGVACRRDPVTLWSCRQWGGLSFDPVFVHK